MSLFKLTEFSHGAGCGCKISPAVLDTILAQTEPGPRFSTLLVGNDQRDDAAVVDLGDGTAIVSTTDFFMPIVDDAETFGRIAATNAISDIYAMGATPVVAIAILGWPINLLPPELAGRVLEGGRKVCERAGIPLAGGHSIDSPEPIFGLAVTGRVAIDQIKRNAGARAGDLLFLTKPLGVGILSTAQKKKQLRTEDAHLATQQMTRLNDIGAKFGPLPYVHAVTDVTGFGLLGHLTELCKGSGLKAIIREKDVPLIDADVLDYYLGQGCIPGGTRRNLVSYQAGIKTTSERQQLLFADPQTSGGLLCAVDPTRADEFTALCGANGHVVASFGSLYATGDNLIEVK